VRSEWTLGGVSPVSHSLPPSPRRIPRSTPCVAGARLIGRPPPAPPPAPPRGAYAPPRPIVSPKRRAPSNQRRCLRTPDPPRCARRTRGSRASQRRKLNLIGKTLKPGYHLIGHHSKPGAFKPRVNCCIQVAAPHRVREVSSASCERIAAP
jgi:hypothetical protein